MGGGEAKKLAFLKIIYIFTTYTKISARLKHFLFEIIFGQKRTKKGIKTAKWERAGQKI